MGPPEDHLQVPALEPWEALSTLGRGQTFLRNRKEIGHGQSLTGTVPTSEYNLQDTKRGLPHGPEGGRERDERERERERD